jgi:hypothetical protein
MKHNKDKHLMVIENEIKNKKKLLAKKSKDLEERLELNIFLNDVRQDYLKYYNGIIDEKRRQYQSLMLLKEYMNEMIKTDDMLNSQYLIAKHDQQNIVNEINKVKRELDDLMSQ